MKNMSKDGWSWDGSMPFPKLGSIGFANGKLGRSNEDSGKG